MVPFQKDATKFCNSQPSPSLWTQHTEFFTKTTRKHLHGFAVLFSLNVLAQDCPHFLRSYMLQLLWSSHLVLSSGFISRVNQAFRAGSGAIPFFTPAQWGTIYERILAQPCWGLRSLDSCLPSSQHYEVSNANILHHGCMKQNQHCSIFKQQEEKKIKLSFLKMWQITL